MAGSERRMRWSLALLVSAPAQLITRHPILVLLFIRVLKEIFHFVARRKLYVLSRRRVLGGADEIDFEVVQGCLLSTEELISLGRVEKRTLFTRSMLDLLGGNTYLVDQLRKAANQCRQANGNCIVTRYLPPDEKYHILQASLNATSALFAANYVYMNAMNAESEDLFKSTWYCVTIMMPTRPEAKKGSKARGRAVETCTFTDMSRVPRQTLRVVLANESEVRRIADGKLRPPSWGFFNNRHAERYRMLVDFARNFQKQLVRTSANSKQMNTRSPFTSEKVYMAGPSVSEQSDGGLMKRVQSQPSLSAMASSKGGLSAMDRRGGSVKNTAAGFQRTVSDEVVSMEETDTGDGATEDNCFLRLHVPHFVGKTVVHNEIVVDTNDQTRLVRSGSGNLRVSTSSSMLRKSSSSAQFVDQDPWLVKPNPKRQQTDPLAERSSGTRRRPSKDAPLAERSSGTRRRPSKDANACYVQQTPGVGETGTF
eukprot:gnl/TRDRNA2_/TRDRNA2_151330_c1_seq1.p1 gnl/TRDRNA2_/TRDRNA2_151330_c1~~gnl/TRDRNA2_/TRDRNA2_151330_c1_seq1.p1  ORF type:complete len:497 (-),score=63.24 gnl/TRDRNA2_/TRDRNA2_151330_c1_seq1:9-1454(-)